MIYRFEDFELDEDAYELRRCGAGIAVEPQVFGVLSYLVKQAGRVARKEEILAAVWGTTFVSDAALTTRIRSARQALGDDGSEQRLVKTVHGIGYRFVGDVRSVSGATLAPPAPAAGPGSVQFCTASDGVRIAMATTGTGPPFVKAANWLTHLEYDELSPVWRHLINEFSRDHTFVRYDERGSGLSDRDLDEDSFSLDAWVRDLATVVDSLGLERFPLLGISQGAAVAVAFAAMYPERVSHLVLHGAYARGRNHRDASQAELNRALVALTASGWGEEHSAHAHMFAARLIPRGTTEQVRWLIDLQRLSASRENAVRFRRAFGDVTVESLLPRVSVPTLVLHCRGDQASPFEEGRRLAAGIPGARFVSLESDNHLVLEDEPAWPRMVESIRAFLQS